LPDPSVDVSITRRICGFFDGYGASWDIGSAENARCSVSTASGCFSDPDSLIGSIYDAAFDEKSWVSVMNGMADRVGGGPR
jgi:hypothetical protein